MMLRLIIQETGRAGRDREPSEALLNAKSNITNRFLEQPMKEYIKNKEICRRAMLLKDFDGDEDFLSILLAVMFVNSNAHAKNVHYQLLSCK